jgi:transcriptional regulator with XRE-family HTH domain
MLMGANIPGTIKVQVIRKWLEGKSRDKIVEEVGISAGTVSSILKENRHNDPPFNTMREVAVKLSRQGESMESFAHLLRCRQILRKIEGLEVNTKSAEDGEEDYKQPHTKQQEVAKGEEKIESLIVALEVHCFKAGLPINEFIDLVDDISSAADRLGVTLENLPSYVRGLEDDTHRLRKEVQQINLQKQQALLDSHTTKELLEEFEQNRPLFARNQELKEKINTTTLEIERLRTELERRRVSNVIDEYEMAISEDELEEASRELGVNLDPDKLHAILMEVYHQPSKYTDMIAQRMRRQTQ